MSNVRTSVTGMIVLLLLFATQVIAEDRVEGNLILFDANGAWCWFQDERVLVDPVGGKLIIGAVSDDQGFDGKDREGDINITSFDLKSGERQRFVLDDRLISYGSGDDHNAPALWIRPDGRYYALWAGHNNDHLSRFRISESPHDASEWGPKQQFNWEAHIPGGSDFPVSYSNLHYLSDEGRLYNISRTDNRSPNIIYSEDYGETWTYGGKLAYTEAAVGYVNGYLKYVSNGKDRIHFTATEHHPRDFNNSVYHGYIEGGKSHRSDGTVVDENIFDEEAPSPDQFTPVFAAGTAFNGEPMTHAWTVDVHLDDAGHPHTIFTTRADGSTEDHRFFYARYDGDRWHVHHVAKAGPGIYKAEMDYLGLAAIDPNALNEIYVSTPVDPRNDQPLDHHEIFKGITSDGGKTWQWTALTEDSTVDNLRPVVPAWDEAHTAVLWYRGDYTWQHEFDTAVVGIVERKGETAQAGRHVKAGPESTTIAGDAPSAGGDQQPDRRLGNWSQQSDETAALRGSSNASQLKTTAAVDEAGVYDIWVTFWADPTHDHAIKAGLSQERMRLFRHMAAEQVEKSDLSEPATFESHGRQLYRAYLGRISLETGESFDVLVSPDHRQNGHTTWYDGVIYSRLKAADH